MKGYRKTNKYFLFWGSIYSQWFKVKFKDKNGLEFSSAEQFMFYHKAKLFNDKESLNKIMNTSDPKKQKNLGRKVKNFNEEIWKDYRYKIILLGNYYKFSQNELLKKNLFSHNLYFVEASPVDSIYGIGLHYNNKESEDISKWKGLNLLGDAINETKNILEVNNLNLIKNLEDYLY